MGALTPANAAPISVTYSGTVSGGNDAINVFGGGSLTGDRVTFTMSYDPATYATQAYFYGGSQNDYFFNDTAGSSSVSIQLSTLSSQTYSYALTSGGAYISNDFAYAGGDNTSSHYGLGVYAPLAGYPTTQGTLQPTIFTANAWTSGVTIFNAPSNVTSASFVIATDAGSGNSDYLSITNITEGVPAPEPLSISVLGAGMFGLGWLRRRRGASRPLS